MLTLLNLTLQLFKCLHIESTHQVQPKKRRHNKVNRANESAFYSFRKYKKTIANVILISYITMPGALLADGLSAAAGSANAPTFNTAANGVPIVNINAPTSKGVSRNEYQEFKVDSKGLIFNNSPDIVSTDLAGYIDGNANLKGNSASIILNEVTGNSHSALNGYMEIAGQEAELVIANRHGITCNGCGFINTTRGVLTTGEAIINNGALEGYNIAQGQVTIEGLGLNSPETEQIDILARSIAVNGELWANQTTLISGQNNIKHLRDNEGDLTVRTLTKDEVDATTINSTESQGAPTFALDVAAIGGMYASRITLIGTETGLGVNNDGNLVATEKMVLQADGTITNRGALTADSISITHYNEPSAIALNNQGDIATQNSLSIDANKINNNGNIIAQGDNTFTAKAIENQGNITSGANLLITTTALTNGTDTQGNKASLKGQQVDLQTASLTNGTQGQIVSNERLLINDAGQAADISNAGILLAQDIDLTVSTLDNSGAIVSQTALDIDGDIITNSGNLVATDNNTITANTVKNQGNITSDANLLIITDTLTNNDAAQLIAANDLTVSNAEQAVLINNAGILSAQNSTLQAAELTNSGDIVASNTLTINANSLSNSGNLVATNDNTITANSVDNQGNIVSDANLLVTSDSLTNSDTAQLIAANDLTVSNVEQAVLINNAGILSAQNSTLQATELTNSGDIVASNTSTINANSLSNSGNLVATNGNTITANSVDNQGNIVSDANLLITTDTLTNSDTAQLIAANNLTVSNAEQAVLINNAGILSAQNAILLASTLINSGDIIANGASIVEALTFLNTGNIVATENNTVTADSVDNQGNIVSDDNLIITTDTLTNSDAAQLIAANDLTVSNAEQAVLINNAGILSAQNSTLQAAELTNSGDIVASNTSTINANSLSNSGNLVATNDNTITANSVDNQGNIVSDANLLITTDTLTNSDTAQLIAANDLTVNNAEQAVLINNAGILSAQNATLLASTLINSGDIIANSASIIEALTFLNTGNIVATADNTVTADSVDNQGNIVSDANLLITTDALTNSNTAQLIAGKDLTISNAEQAVTMTNEGILSANNATLFASTLINSGDIITNSASIIEALTFLNTGNIVATADNTVTADSVDNQGNIVSDSSLLITTGTLINGTNAQGNKAQLKGLQVNLQTQHLTNGDQGQIISEDTLTVNNENQAGLVDNTGELSAQNTSLFTSTLDNSGNIISQETLALNATTINNDGLIVSVEDTTITADTLLNKKTISGNNLTLNTNSLENKDSDALILGRNSLIVNADEALNQNGAVIYSLGDDATITVTDALTNSSASIEASGNLTIDAKKIINKRDGEFIVNNTTIDNGAVSTSSGDVVYNYTQSTKTPTASTENADAGEIIAAGNLTLNADNGNETGIFNFYSTITAGGELTYKGGLLNKAFTADQVISITGKKTAANKVSVRVNDHESGEHSHGGDWAWVTTYETESYSENNKSIVVLASAIFTANKVINGSGGDVINTGGGSNNNDTPKIDDTPTAEVEDVSVKEVNNADTKQVSDADAKQVTDAGTKQVTDADTKQVSDADTKQVSKMGIEEIDESSINKASEQATALLDASSALFNNASENSPYLYETNPAFTSYQNFISSDYFFNTLGLNDRDTKRAGDGFYEQQLIKNQLIDLTGVQFLNEQNNAEDQYIALMNNALAQYENTNLIPGQALTDQQRAELTQPIVWMVEEQVETAFGLQAVLVPRVYLPRSMDMMLREDGAMIAANTVNIEADNFENSGLVRAQDSLVIDANNINNTGSLAATETLSLTAANDLTSTGGSISGNDVTLNAGNDVTLAGSEVTAISGLNLTAGNDINLAAIATTEVTGFSDEKTTTTTHQTTALSAANIIFNAGNTFTSEAANINAIDALNISARNIDLLAVIDSTSQSNSNGYKHKSSSQSESAVVTNFTSGGDLTLNAINDIYSEGAGLDAGGDIAFTAGNDILLSTVTTTQSTDGKHGNTKTSSEDITNQGTSVTSDGNIQFSSGNDLTLYGSTANAEGSIDAKAGGDVQLLAAVDQASESYYSKKKSTFKVKIKSSGSVEQTAVVSGFTSNSGDLSVEADGNISTEGAILASTNGTLSLGAGGTGAEAATLDENGNYVSENGEAIGNITLGTKELHSSSWDESSSSLRGGLKSLVKGLSVVAASIGIKGEIEVGQSDAVRTESTTHAVTTVNATNLDIDAANDVAFIGTEVTATDTANIDAKNVTIDAVLNTTTHNESHSSETISSDGASFSEDNGEATLISLSETKQTDTTTTTAGTWQGASFDVGNLNINAEEDVAIIASDIDVANDANIEGKNVLVGGREDTVETTTESITKTETLTVGVKNAYVDIAYAANALNDAKNAVRDANKAYEEAKGKVENGTLAAESLDYYRMNKTMATANVATAALALAASVATGAAAAAAGGTGMTVTAGASTQEDITNTTSTQTNWNGSSIKVGGNATLSSDNLLAIKGSSIQTTETMTIEAETIDITAGENTKNSTTDTTSKGTSLNVSLNVDDLSKDAYGLALNDFIPSGIDTEGDQINSNTSYVNSVLKAGEFVSESDSLALQGASVKADSIDITTTNLLVESLQNTSVSNSNSNSNGLLSDTHSESNTERSWVDEQSGIVGETVNIVAKDTTIIGSVIAATDEQGNDNGQLNLITNSLNSSHIQDTDESYSEGQVFELSFSETTYGRTNRGYEREQTTFATIGTGSIEVQGNELTQNTDGDAINRNITSTQVITMDREIGGLDFETTVDNTLIMEYGIKYGTAISDKVFGPEPGVFAWAAEKVNAANEMVNSTIGIPIYRASETNTFDNFSDNLSNGLSNISNGLSNISDNFGD